MSVTLFTAAVKVRSAGRVTDQCPECSGELFRFEGEAVCQDCTRYEPVSRPAPSRGALRSEPAKARRAQRPAC